jgi:hypothetical protein
MRQQGHLGLTSWRPHEQVRNKKQVRDGQVKLAKVRRDGGAPTHP